MKKAKIQSTGFLREKQVLQLIPVGRTTWWAGVKSGKFPKAIKLSERVTAWKTGDIQKLIESLSEQALKQVNENKGE